ncbi:MAG: histidine kinase [Bacteroidetes bacterium]|nr:histidine kinase [Bacteroidota bacterium]
MEKGLFQSILPKKEDILKELSEIKELLNSDKEAALERIKYVEQQCKILNFEKGIGFCNNLYGIYYHFKDLNEKALHHYFIADNILSKSEDWQDRILAKTNIGIIYSKLDQFENCLAIYKAVEKEIELQPQSMLHAQVYVNIDAVLIRMQDFENGYKYLKKAALIVEKFDNKFGIALCYSNSISYLIQLNEFESAKQYAEKAIKICKAHKFEQLLCSILLAKAKIYFGEKNYEFAILVSDDCLKQIENHFMDDFLLQDLLKLRMNIFEANANFSEALNEAKKYIVVRDRFNNNEKLKRINELQIQFETEKKETELKELKILQQKNLIEKAESELKAIKAQMNPHFIFNALNSIQELYTIGDKKMANEQMGNFAQLTRKILDVSGKQKVDLSEEIEILTKYLELESMRFENDFSYAIDLGENIDEEYLQIPPMLIQPYVENSIKHGLLHKKGIKYSHLF